MKDQNKTNSSEVIPLKKRDGTFENFAPTLMVSVLIMLLYYLFPPSIDMHQEKTNTMFMLNNFTVLYSCATLITYCLFLKVKITKLLLFASHYIIITIYIVGSFILTALAERKFAEWHHNTKLLERAVLNKDKDAAELFYLKLISTLDDQSPSKKNICQTKETLPMQILSSTADVLALNGDFKGALSCIDRASDDISKKTYSEKKRYSSILAKLLRQKYNLCLEFKDYTNAFLIYIQLEKNKQDNIINQGYSFAKGALQNKDAKTASGVFQLLLSEMGFAQTPTIANLCHSKEDIFPELLVVAADILSLEKHNTQSAHCLDKALYSLRYNLSKNPFFQKITVKEILNKRQKHS